MSRRSRKRKKRVPDRQLVVVYVAETPAAHGDVMKLLLRKGFGPQCLDPVPKYGRYNWHTKRLHARIAVPPQFADEARAFLTDWSAQTSSRADQIERKMFRTFIGPGILALVVSAVTAGICALSDSADVWVPSIPLGIGVFLVSVNKDRIRRFFEDRRE